MQEQGRQIPVDAYHALASIIKCKWTLAILDAMREGASRPSDLRRRLPGLTAKVLAERVKKLQYLRIIDKVEYPEIPPRVEYSLTPHGRRLVELLDSIKEFARDVWTDADVTSQQR